MSTTILNSIKIRIFTQHLKMKNKKAKQKNRPSPLFQEIYNSIRFENPLLERSP